MEFFPGGCVDTETQGDHHVRDLRGLVHDGDVADFDPADRAPEHPLLHVTDQIVIIDHDKPAEIAQAFIDGVRH